MRALILSASSLALVLTMGSAHAYRIVEGKYRVEISPGVYQDQLLVRCDDGRELTLPWETRLREACGESLMGSAAASPPERPADTRAAASPAAAAPPVDFGASAEVQKRMQLTRLRLQAGDVPEHLVSFQQGPDGPTLHYAPELTQVLKQFESCRQARRDDCVAVRNAAYDQFRGSRPLPGRVTAAAAAPATAETISPPPGTRRSIEPRVIEAAPGEAAPRPAQSAAAQRAAAEAEIARQHEWCMRAKPKYECEQARRRALAQLDKPKKDKARRPAASPARVGGPPQT